MIDLNRKLPIGIQTFEKIRKENYLYVDKTALVGKMVSTSLVSTIIRGGVSVMPLMWNL